MMVYKCVPQDLPAEQIPLWWQLLSGHPVPTELGKRKRAGGRMVSGGCCGKPGK